MYLNTVPLAAEGARSLALATTPFRRTLVTLAQEIGGPVVSVSGLRLAGAASALRASRAIPRRRWR